MTSAPSTESSTIARWITFDFALSKVPQVTAAFWVIKVLSTGMGEATSDYLVRRFGGPSVVPVGALGFALILLWQLNLRRFSTRVYWLTVVMVSVFGTMAADTLHIGLHVPYAESTPFFAIVLAVVFWWWRRIEHTLSIHSIITRRRELFYWATVSTTFALGTAAGDLTSRTLHLGYLGSTFLFAGAIAIPALVFFANRAHPILYFWIAYVITRPLGASGADYMAFGKLNGGLGWGFGPVIALWTGLIVCAVAYLAVRARSAAGANGANATS